MKKLALILSLLLLLTACGSTVEPVVTTEAPVAEATVIETAAQTEAPAEAPTETPTEAEPTESALDLALSFVDKPLEELMAVLGEPGDAYYEESCIGEGEDGILTYDGFTVYTFRPADGSAETVVDAERND